jgi:predicted kinase
MTAPLLVVLAGRPGTGKTTLARRLAPSIGALYIRIDAIETAVVRAGLAQPPVGPVGYVVAHELARANLALGTPVVIDAVNPVAEARAGWAGVEPARLVFLETVLPDADEHRRRVATRCPDMHGQAVPTWDDVLAGEYQPWDERRDGARHVVDTTDADRAVAAALTAIGTCRPVVDSPQCLASAPNPVQDRSGRAQ